METDLETTLPTQAIATLDMAITELGADTEELTELLGPAPATELERRLNATLREIFGLNASVRVQLFPGDASLELTLDPSGAKELFTLSLPTVLRDVVIKQPG